MPYQWVAPEEFASAEEIGGDVAVCHCYNSGDVMEFHYQIESELAPGGWMAFDIRDLARALELSLAFSGALGIIQAALERYGPPLEDIIDSLIDWYEGETE